MRALSERVVPGKKIGDYKKKMRLPIADVAREQGILERIVEEAGKIGLPKDKTGEHLQRDHRTLPKCTDA